MTQHELNTVSRVGVVGLGTIGAQELALWRRAGLDPIGYDISEARAQSLGGTTRIEDLEPADALILCLPNLALSGENSMEAFDHFVEMAQQLGDRERLVVIASTVPIGFTRNLARRLGRHGRIVAHAPERFDPGRGTELGEIARVVGALTEHALNETIALYSGAKVPTHRVEPVEVAEASKLLENSFRLVNISFINEFAELCRRMGIVAADVIDAAATKPFAFMAHQPGVGAGGTCIPTMPRYLLDAASENGIEMPILRDAVRGNEQVIERVADHVQQMLASDGGKRARVLVVGATYKPNYPDARASAALAFARGLSKRHDVVVYDPIVDATNFPQDVPLVRELPKDQRFDAVVIALKHRDTDVAALRQMSPILMDLVRGAVEATESISARHR
ncbi:MAG TPA: nucleotide sugar dehydrogenase [Candidatus Limnocylindrales bacterium]|nr:nucleotide sugar dehydrogenase [Candidatus Limnocylindrales bacterium]